MPAAKQHQAAEGQLRYASGLGNDYKARYGKFEHRVLDVIPATNCRAGEVAGAVGDQADEAAENTRKSNQG